MHEYEMVQFVLLIHNQQTTAESYYVSHKRSAALYEAISIEISQHLENMLRKYLTMQVDYTSRNLSLTFVNACSICMLEMCEISVLQSMYTTYLLQCSCEVGESTNRYT